VNREIELRDDIARAWAGRDPFDVALHLDGTAVREVAERSTIRAVIDGRVYYVKRHFGVGWREIFKNLVTLKRPVIDAGNEYKAILDLSAGGLHTLTVAGFGCNGLNPATRRSFLITDELTGTQTLEQVCLRWLESPPSLRTRLQLIERVGEVARRMHALGYVHQDFYLCHLLLAGSSQPMDTRAREAPIFVMDLHRAVFHSRIPFRARVKDLGGLFFSAFEIGLRRRDVLRFLQVYFDAPLRSVLTDHAGLLAACERRARSLYDKARRKRILPRQLAGIEK
jgi:heptose I phosphotransferase